MQRSQLIITVVLLALLLIAGFAARLPITYGAVPWFGWIGLMVFVALMGAALIIYDTSQRRARVLIAAQTVPEITQVETAAPQPVIVDPNGPNYPHPVINAQTCIGCHACVDACPHDVLAIVNGISTPIALEQCMEDTSCQVECPVNPKACIVVNTTKKIKPRQGPKRDASLMTDVPGVYLIGDVSGTPLIKNAANEGASVAVHIAHELHAADGNGGPPQAQYDVAIIGAGPAGLSAAVMAKRLGLSY